ncbi:MAG TPA: DUF3105 domain-containing protein [Candidatus Limnocylindrales bacterium]|nr:DUF3105 domain-containing protein [Candidatus Limnocylindrales bacterium]
MSKESRRAARAAARQPGTGSSGPSGGARAGRRERPRYVERRSFLERYRTLLIGGVVVAIGAVALSVIFVGATQAAYSCGIQWEPSPTTAPAPGATARIGYLQDGMGADHNVAKPQRYTFCPPATGNHYNLAGSLGPVAPRVYGPNDNVGPSNWIHNLEHGGLVILYRGDSEGATQAGQDRFQRYLESLPNSPICDLPTGQLSPVIGRFDAMRWPYAALVWGRVLPLPEWDADLVTQFYLTEAERLDADGAWVSPPEAQCPAPSTSPSPSGSAAPSAGASASPAPSGSAAPSASASPTPAAS